MGSGHTLRRIRDQISGHQGVFHTLMAHGDPVTDSNCREYTGNTACHSHTQLYGLCDLVQIHMARNDLVIRIDNTDQRLVHLFFCQAQRMEQRSVGCLLDSFFYCITLHISSYSSGMANPFFQPVALYFLCRYKTPVYFCCVNNVNRSYFSQIRSAIRSPIFAVPTFVQPSDQISPVRYPSASTCFTAFSIPSAASSRSSE